MSRSKSKRLVWIEAAVAVAVVAAAGGWFLVRGNHDHAKAAVTRPAPEPHFATKVARGQYLFKQKGCFACHGENGRGGVVNANYIRGTVPALNLLAERLMVDDQDDANTIVGLMEKGQDLDALRSKPPFPRYNVFLAQYHAVKQLIQNGNPAAKKDPNGPMPPLQMPSWRGQLNDQDMTDIIAYLITQYPFDAEADDSASDSDSNAPTTVAVARADNGSAGVAR